MTIIIHHTSRNDHHTSRNYHDDHHFVLVLYGPTMFHPFGACFFSVAKLQVPWPWLMPCGTIAAYSIWPPVPWPVFQWTLLGPPEKRENDNLQTIF